MEHEIEDLSEAIEIIAAYLERLGVEGLRQPYDPQAINKSAVIRYLIAEKLGEAIAHPPSPTGQARRAGQASKKKSTPNFDQSSTKKRQ